jgi:hypothetical protein
MKRYLSASAAVVALVFSLNTNILAQSKPADLPAQNQIDCPDGSDDPVQPPRVSIEIGLDLLSKRLTIKVGVTQSATPANIDTVCPTVVSAYIEQLVKQMSESIAAAQKQAAEKRSLEVRLFDPVKVRIEQVPLKHAVKHLAFASGLPIVIDHKAMRDARINLDTPVTLKGENLSAHRALRQFLDGLGLTYEINDGLVRITTPSAPMGPRGDTGKREQLAERIFDVGEKCRRSGDYSRARACYQQVHLLTPTAVIGRVAMVRIAEIEERIRVDSEEQGNPRSADPEEAFQHMRNRTVPLGLVEVSY